MATDNMETKLKQAYERGFRDGKFRGFADGAEWGYDNGYKHGEGLAKTGGK